MRCSVKGVKSKTVSESDFNKYYLVTKEFTSGLLKGLTVREKTQIIFRVGRHYHGLCGSSNYIVTEFEPWDERTELKVRRENLKDAQEVAVKVTRKVSSGAS